MFAAIKPGFATTIAVSIGIFCALVVGTSVFATAEDGSTFGLLAGSGIGVTGVLAAYIVARRLTSSHRDLVPAAVASDCSFGAQNGKAPAPHRDFNPSSRIGDRDSVTGLLNRHAFIAFTDDAIPYFKRYGRTIGIVRIDLDGFEDLRDVLGADGSNDLLRHVADVLTLPIRVTDKVSRFDGTRFVLLVREIDECHAVALAERMRTSILAFPFQHGDRSFPLSISAGVAIVSPDDYDMQALIDRAETALDLAIRSGGNRVSGHDEASVASVA